MKLWVDDIRRPPDDSWVWTHWMAERNLLPPEITIHSWNSVGAKKMSEILCAADPDIAVRITIQPYRVPQDRRS